MSYQPEVERIVKQIFKDVHSVSEHERNVIKQALKQSYDVGYEDGLTDGEEISEKPISG
ncbi:hypothetical protein [Salinibacillus xinjiangensis]|uniref:Uncharacterized protein n=1 Tax=Salinibacillus xinjiangensis TaxID=1229268 RepID=A0A6G1X4F6_9BACI|nr:hypothetical protein [Salinibacillus xinjiangensis]MRG85844.1 hypothetical protein [Salinibacillus xinjiangensis]